MQKGQFVGFIKIDAVFLKEMNVSSQIVKVCSLENNKYEINIRFWRTFVCFLARARAYGIIISVCLSPDNSR